MEFLVLAGLAVLAWRWWGPKPTRRTGAAAQARALLEVGPRADAETIRAAHRRLIARVHPDAGGSAELTRRVNEARDILLARLNRGEGRGV